MRLIKCLECDFMKRFDTLEHGAQNFCFWDKQFVPAIYNSTDKRIDMYVSSCPSSGECRHGRKIDD